MSVYAISDLHGRYDLFTAIKNFLQENDTVYMLGDCADRGPDGWKIINEVLNDPRFIYIKGNHEDMLEGAMRNYISCKSEQDKEFFFDWDYKYRLCRHNGGESTFKTWIQDTGANIDFIKILNALPTHATYTNSQNEIVYLSHAGFTPYGVLPTDYDLIWDRSHFEDEIDEYWEPNTIIVHGHTPIPIMNEFLWEAPKENECEPGAFWYANNRKVNIDCGSVWTGCTVLLDLDTWDEQIFTAEDCTYMTD